jgi:hypothetical protein
MTTRVRSGDRPVARVSPATACTPASVVLTNRWPLAFYPVWRPARSSRSPRPSSPGRAPSRRSRRFSTPASPPGTSRSSAIAIAAPGFALLLVLVGGLPGLGRADALRLAFAGVLVVAGYHLSLNFGTRFTTAGTAAILVALAQRARTGPAPRRAYAATASSISGE